MIFAKKLQIVLQNDKNLDTIKFDKQIASRDKVLATPHPLAVGDGLSYANGHRPHLHVHYIAKFTGNQVDWRAARGVFALQRRKGIGIIFLYACAVFVLSQNKGGLLILKTAKLVIGIISIVLFIIIMFQSCATGMVNVIESNDDVSGSAGMLLAFSMLIAGIIGVAARKSKGAGITAGVFYIVASLIGFANLGTFGDLVVWSVVSFVFGIVFILGSRKMENKKEVPTASGQ